MTLSLQVESLKTCASELIPLLIPHWQEVGQDKQRLLPNPNWDRYNGLENADALLLITMREGEELVGYHVSLLDQHLHYKHVRVAKSDVYYLAPRLRRGWEGLRLFRFVEQELRARGVQVFYEITKTYQDAEGQSLDHGKLFEHLGFRPIERTYSKWIGED